MHDSPTPEAATGPAPDTVIAALRTNHDDLSAVVKGLGTGDLTRPSGAAEWTVAQVLSHLGSGAEIGLAVLRAAQSGTDAPDQDFNQSVWDRWNAQDPDEHAAGFLAADAELVAAFEELSANARRNLRIKFGFLPAPVDVTLAAGLRLNEAALHAWDVRVASDQKTTLAPDAAQALIDLYGGPLGFLVGFIGKGAALGGREVTLRVETTEPVRALGLAIGESVAVVAAPEAADAVLNAPAESVLRLLAGRLHGAHTPADVTVSGAAVTLDDLRQVFPGY